MTTEFKSIELSYWATATAIIPKDAEITGDKYGVLYYKWNGKNYKVECKIDEMDYKRSDGIEEFADNASGYCPEDFEQEED